MSFLYTQYCTMIGQVNQQITGSSSLVPRSCAQYGSTCRQGRTFASASQKFKLHDSKICLLSACRRTRCQIVRSTVCKAGGEVLVAGATGQTAARISLQLAKSGFKVTAGVDDVEAAQQAIEFAKQLELLLPTEAAAVKTVELDVTDSEALAAALPKGKGARVVLVAGDNSVENRRVDPKVVQRAVDALTAAGKKVAQLVLVTPVGGPSGTGIFGFGASKSRPDVLSKLEQQVVESGLPYLIVRTAPSDKVSDRYAEQSNVVVSGFGSLPQGLSVARSQVAAAVVEAMSASQSFGIVEVGADPEGPDEPLADQLAQVLAEAAIQAAEQRAQDFDIQAAAQEQDNGKSVGGVLGTMFKSVAGTAKGTSKQQQQVEEVVEEVVAAKRGGGLFGGQRAKQAKTVEEQQEAEEKPATRRQPVLSFGTRGGGRTSKQQQQQDEQEEVAPAAPAKRAGGGLFGSQKKEVPAAAVQQEQEEKPRGGGLFSRSGGATAKQAQQEAQSPEPPARQAAPAISKVKRGRNPLPPPEEPKPARAVAATSKEDQAPPSAKKEKKGGLLQALGIGQSTAYVDEL